jgi:hypothetical protein
MSDQPAIDWDRIPEKHRQKWRELYEVSRAEITQKRADGPTIVMFGATMVELEAMGPEVRVLLGLEVGYQNGLRRGDNAESLDE